MQFSDPSYATIVAALAAIVTAWMALETRRMANAASRSADLERQPILGIRDVRFEGLVAPQAGQINPNLLTGARVAVELFNAGRVPLHYRMEAMSVTFAGRTNDTPTYSLSQILTETLEYTVARSAEGLRCRWLTVDEPPGG